MPTMIPPTRVVRRVNAKRTHITDTKAGRDLNRPREVTMCGQSLRPRSVRVYVVRTAEQVTCNDCLVSAISKGRAS